jgi:prepilin-type N-terminal cleavage/methylation domain-containing protein
MNLPSTSLPRAPAVRRRGRWAFTLLELMLALAVFSMVITAIYASWSAVLRSIRVGDQAAAEAQRARVASRALQTALGSAVMFLMNRNLYRFEADTSEEFAALSFVARLPASFPGSGYYGDQIVRRVAFVVEPGEDGVNELRLVQFPILAGEISDEELHPLTLARDVSVFMLEFNDGRSGEWMDEWTDTNSLPRLVRFALAFGKRKDDSNKPREMVVRSVLLPGTAVHPIFQGMIGRGRRQVRPPGAPSTTPGQLSAPRQPARLQPARPR